MSVGAKTTLGVHAGQSLGVSTAGLSVSVTGVVDAVAGERMSVRSDAVSVEASTSMTVSTKDAVVRASGGVEGYVSEGVSVSAGGVSVRSGDSLSASAVTRASLVSGGSVSAEAGLGVSVSAGEAVSVTAAEVSVASTGDVGVLGVDVTAEASGSLRALGVSSVSVESAGGVSVSAGSALSAVAGTTASLVTGSGMSVSGAAGLEAVFGAGVELTGEAVRVEAASSVEASTGGSVSVSGYEGVGVSWESARSFDSFENVVSPSVADVEEVVIVQGDSPQSGPYARGASVVYMDVHNGAAWVNVWSASLGAEAYYSLGGLSVRFERQTVSALRLRSEPALSPTFEGWEGVVVHLGTRASGAVSVASERRIEASAGEEVSVSSTDVRVSAGGMVRCLRL